VRAEQVHHVVGSHEASEAVDAQGERSSIANVQSSGVERVPSEQNASASVVHGDARRLMARNRDHIQHATAEIDRPEVFRPAPNAEERAHRRTVATYDCGPWSTHELAVTRHVVAVSVAMGDNECHRLACAPVPREPRPNESVDRSGDIHAPCPGVEQQRALLTEQQIEKRLLVVRTCRLAQDIEVGVVRVHPELRRARAVRTAGVEARGQLTQLLGCGRWPAANA